MAGKAPLFLELEFYKWKRRQHHNQPTFHSPRNASQFPHSGLKRVAYTLQSHGTPVPAWASRHTVLWNDLPLPTSSWRLVVPCVLYTPIPVVCYQQPHQCYRISHRPPPHLRTMKSTLPFLIHTPQTAIAFKPNPTRPPLAWHSYKNLRIPVSGIPHSSDINYKGGYHIQKRAHILDEKNKTLMAISTADCPYSALSVESQQRKAIKRLCTDTNAVADGPCLLLRDNQGICLSIYNPFGTKGWHL